MPRLHYTKSGALDMRYSSSKAAVASGYSGGGGSCYYSGGGGNSYYSGGGGYAPSGSGDLHYKKDGSLDMRYSSSKAAANSSSYSPSFSESGYGSSSGEGLHYKKDGTLDMRYSSSKAAVSTGGLTENFSNMNLRLKRDGTPDMRFNSSKAAVAGNRFVKGGFPSHIPLTKSGLPDMRTAAAKDWVKNQAKGFDGSNCVPDWLPRIKDGSLDFTKAVTQEYFRSNGYSALNDSTFYNPCNRNYYYEEKLRHPEFQRVVDQVRTERVECKENVLLPNTEALKTHLRGQNSTNFDVHMSGSTEYFTCISDSQTLKSLNLPNIQNINPDELQLEKEELGRGAFGTVFKGTWAGKIVAVKKLHLQKLTRKEKDSFQQEIKILGDLGAHPNLVELYAYCLDPPIMVLEFAQLGSLSHLLHYNDDNTIVAKMSDGRYKKRIIVGIVSGMKQIHAVNIVHGDLKPQNILVSNDFEAKITDFGLATLRGKTSTTVDSSMTVQGDKAVGGTAGYMAPELLDSSGPPELSSDVYSFGILLNELIHEEEPYSDQYKNFLGRGPFAAAHHAKLGNRPKIHEKTPSDLKQIITKCWSAIPKNRPTFSKVAVSIEHTTFPNSF